MSEFTPPKSFTVALNTAFFISLDNLIKKYLLAFKNSKGQPNEKRTELHLKYRKTLDLEYYAESHVRSGKTHFPVYKSSLKEDLEDLLMGDCPPECYKLLSC